MAFKSDCEKLLDQALSDAETCVHRVSVPFDSGGTKGQVRRVYKLSDVTDTYIEREQFEDKLLEMYRRVKVGQVSKVVAGTGVGKSTKMPVMLAVDADCVCVVLSPTSQMAKTLATYVRFNVATGRYDSCSVSYQDSYSGFTRLAKPAVAYFGANEFLAVLSSHQDMFSERHVGFVYVDESHERIPAYTVIRYLVSLNLFKSTKVFMGSATSSRQNMESRSAGVKQVLRGMKPVDMAYDDIDSITARSPLNHSNISGRTLIFVPSAQYFDLLYEYYEDNAVRCLVIKPDATRTQMDGVNDVLGEVSHVVVVLATPVHQTGYTFDVDAVIDCGVTSYLEIDTITGDVAKRERVVTEFERVQRCGRVGRHTDGVAYYVDAEVADENFELYSGSEIYVALWCKVFNVSVSVQYLKIWFSKLSPISVDCARILLCSRVHPVLLLNYMDSDGVPFAGVRSLFTKILGKTQKLASGSDRLPDQILDEWITLTLTLDGFGELNGRFKVPCHLPGEWYPIVALLYHGIQGVSLSNYVASGSIVRKSLANLDDSESVISFAMTSSSVHSRAPSRVSMHSAGSRRDASHSRAPSVGSVASGSSRLSSRLKSVKFDDVITPDDSISVIDEPVATPQFLRERAASEYSAENKKMIVRPSKPRSVSQVDSYTVRDSSTVASPRYGKQRAMSVTVDNDLLSPGAVGSSRVNDPSQLLGLSGPLHISRPSASRRESSSPVRHGACQPVVNVHLTVPSSTPPKTKSKKLAEKDAIYKNMSETDSDGSVATKKRVLKVFNDLQADNAYDKDRIAPSRLQFQRIRPNLGQYMAQFRSMRIDRAYEEPYRHLSSSHDTLNGLAKVEVVRYFVATILKWNAVISQHFQLKATPHTGLFASRRNDHEARDLREKLVQCRAFLEVFYNLGYGIAIYRGVDQCGVIQYDESLKHAIDGGKQFMRICDIRVARRVEAAGRMLQFSEVADGVGGHYFVDGDRMLMVRHVFQIMRADGVYMRLPRSDVTLVKLLSDQRLYFCRLSVNSAEVMRYRLPVKQESVVVVAFVRRSVPDVLGLYTVVEVGQTCVYDALLVDGMSGAVLVSIADGAIVGFHHGKFIDGPFQGMSEFVNAA